MTQRAPADSSFSELARTKVALLKSDQARETCEARKIRAGGWARITEKSAHDVIESHDTTRSC